MTGHHPVTSPRGSGAPGLSPTAAAAGPDALAGCAWLVETFVRRTPGVTHTVVTTADGLVLAASPHQPGDVNDRLAAVAAGLTSLARATAHTTGGDLLQTTIELDTGHLVARPLGDRDAGTVLALTRTDADPSHVGHQLTLLTRRLHRALTDTTHPTAITPLRGVPVDRSR